MRSRQDRAPRGARGGAGSKCGASRRKQNACSPIFPHAQADFRGSNNTYFNLLSAPGVNFAALTMDTDFLLPTPQFVHGSFFTKAAWVVRGHSKRSYAIVSDANKVAFDVLEANASQKVVAQRSGAWQFWEEDSLVEKNRLIHIPFFPTIIFHTSPPRASPGDERRALWSALQAWAQVGATEFPEGSAAQRSPTLP